MSTELIAGRYELGERLGFGGMSTVQLAFDRRLERHVAVKVLAEHLAHDSQFVSRFRREALAAARLVHPNIVQVFDFGLDDRAERHYIVMEYVRGRSGAEILRDETRLGVPETLALIDGACRGLHYAHRNGVVHRDVKPGNILRSDDGAVKIADFGIAKAMLDQASQLTQPGSVLGTAAYLAPEQAAGEDAGPASDIYGLGVVTYQFLSGRLPYEPSSLTELALMQQRQSPPRLDDVSGDVPPALGLAVHRALALEPEQRYADAEEMREALHAGVRGIVPDMIEPTEATELLPSFDPTDATEALPASESRRLEPHAARRPSPPRYEPEPPPVRAAPERPSRNGRRALLLTVLGLLVVAAIVIAASGSSGEPERVRLGPVDGNSTSEIVDQANQIIDDNTR